MKDFLRDIPNLDAETNDPLLETVQDILDNGGKIPAEVGNAIVLAAVRKTYREAVRSTNLSRRNAIHLWVLTALLAGALAFATAVRHNDLIIINAIHTASGIPTVAIWP